MAWATETTIDADRQRILGPSAVRVHMIEYAWLERFQSAQVFAYRFDAAQFEPYGHAREPHAFVARHTVAPLGPAEPIGDLLALHEAAQIEVRLAHSLTPWWEAVVETTVGFSGIRLGNTNASAG